MTATEKNNVVRFCKVALEIGVILFAVGIAWATLKGKVDTNKHDIVINCSILEDHESEIRISRQEIGEVKSDIREIKVEQRYISSGIDEIKGKMK